MSIKKSISYSFGAQIINTVISFTSSVFITRILGTEGRGENAIFTNASTFAILFFGLSIGSTIPYFINSGKAKAGEILNTTVIIITTGTLLVWLTLELLQETDMLHLALPKKLQSTYYKFLFSSIFFTTTLNSVVIAILNAYKRFKELAFYSVCVQVVPLLIYILLYVGIFQYNKTVPIKTVVNISAITVLLSFFGAIVLMRKYTGVVPAHNVISKNLIKLFFSFSFLAFLGNVMQFFAYRLDYWLVDEYWGAKSLGIYSLATQLAQLLWILPNTVASVLYSYGSHATEEDAINYTIKLKQLTVAVTAVCATIGLALSYFLIPALYGKDFTPAFAIMAWLLTGIVPFCITTVVAACFVSRGLFRINFILSLIMFLISILLYSLLIPKYGLKGGAIASATTYITGSIICEIWFLKKFHIPISRILKFEKNIFSLKIIAGLFKKKSTSFNEQRN